MGRSVVVGIALAAALTIAAAGSARAGETAGGETLDYDEALEKLSAGLFEELGEEATARVSPLIVGRFSYRQSSYAGVCGELLSSELPGHLRRVGGAEVITGGSLEALRDEKLLWESDLVNPATVPSRAGYTAAAGLVRGRYFVDTEAGRVRLSAELVEVATARTLSSCAVTVEAGSLPVPLDEEELAAAGRLVGQLGVVEQAVTETAGDDSGGPKIRVWTADGRSVYHEGEKITFCFRSDRDCFLRLFNVRPDGSAVMIFPNAYRSEAHIEGGKTYRIPDEDMSFEFQVTPPYGPEAVLALATASAEQSGVLTRGLSGATAGEEPLEEASAVKVEQIARLLSGHTGPRARGLMAVPAGGFSKGACTIVTTAALVGETQKPVAE